MTVEVHLYNTTAAWIICAASARVSAMGSPPEVRGGQQAIIGHRT